MKALGVGFTADTTATVTTLSWCFKLTRQDSTIMGFTDHDEDIALDGVTYERSSGFDASQIEQQTGVAVSNYDVTGALWSEQITEDDIEAGLYDDAELVAYRVDWLTLHSQICGRSVIGDIERGQISFVAESRSIASRLDQERGRVFARPCDVEDFGDSRCGVDVTAAGKHANGTVTKVIDRFGFVATGLGSLTSTLSRGRLTWTAGDNDGVTTDILGQTPVGVYFNLTLMLPTTRDIQVGDTFSCIVGCDRTRKACHDDHDNVLNHRGFDSMPGNDFVLSIAKHADPNDGGTGDWGPGGTGGNLP